ncbi:MAG: ferrous iron transport protein A [Proteobacteria bacterium]|nr:ferrous iron transport protein A [Pseudomonadota bacterium]
MNAPLPSSALHRPLGTLEKGAKGTVVALVDIADSALAPGELPERLLEMGFVEGTPVEILHEGPVGRDPVGIRLFDCVIALRRQEANAIIVDS